MKKLIVLFQLITITAVAQHNFTYNNTLIWSKVYSINTSASNLNLHLKKQGATAYFEDNLLNFTINFDSKTLEPYGFKASQYPTYIQLGGNYTGFIEFKDNKYKVTITQIQVTNALDPALQYNISEYVTKKGVISTKTHHQKTLQLLDNYFNTTFTYNKQSDW